MPARGSVFVTPHAVRRYMERCAPGLGYEEARDALLDLFERSHPVKPKHGGAWLFRTGKPLRLRVIVAPPGVHGPLPALTTVLSGHDR